MTVPVPATASAPVSRSVLFETPMRALTFLTGVGRNPGIQHLLATRGWTAADYAEGWRYFHAVAAYDPGTGATATATVASSAIAALDAWDDPNFRIARATLQFRFAAQCDFLFSGELKAARGPEAVVTVKTFLDRVDELESGKGRDKKLHKADLAAVAALAKKGIDQAERTRLRGLLADVSGAAGLAPQASQASGTTPAAEAPAPAAPADIEAAMLGLYGWLHEWAETARVVIKRRDYLIRLGLATPQHHDDEAAGDATTPPAATPAPAKA